MDLLATIQSVGQAQLGALWPLVWNLLKIVCIVLPLLGCVAYLTLWERKMIGWMHIRLGPNRVGPAGLLQPIADGLKLLLKEIVIPAKANKVLFVLAPIMTIMPALAAWSVVPFGPETVLANVNAGLLLLMAITSMEVTASLLQAGHRTLNMLSSAQCVHLHKWFLMKLQWVSYW
jgi:NADH-quinone oxidoreductase subunit H